MTTNIKNKLVGELDPQELAVRLIEIGCKIRRPPGSSGPEAWAEIQKLSDSGKIPAYIVSDFYDMADASIRYFGEQITKMKKVN